MHVASTTTLISVLAVTLMAPSSGSRSVSPDVGPATEIRAAAARGDLAGDCLDGLSSICGQPPMEDEGLSFRADGFFPTGDDFQCSADNPIVAVRWWGTISDETAPHDTSAPVPFIVRFYSSTGTLPAVLLEAYTVDAVETWTGGFARGVEGAGGGDSCPGPEPLYTYEACLDPSFVPTPGTEYWLVINNLADMKPLFWAWHEADVPHPTGNEAVTFGFAGFEPGVINSCPGDFGSLVGPFDLAFELLVGSGGPPIPTVSEWGLAAMAILFVVGGAVAVGRRRFGIVAR